LIIAFDIKIDQGVMTGPVYLTDSDQ